MKKYVCTAGFSVEMFDDDGFSTEKWTSVEEGEIWTVEDTSFRLVGGNDTVRLYRPEGEVIQWLEITKEHLAEYFAPAENI